MGTLLISAYFNRGKVVTLAEKSRSCMGKEWPGQESVCVTWSQQKRHYSLPGSSAHFPASKGCFSACHHQPPESLDVAQTWGVIFFLINFALELGEKCEIFI